MELKDQKWAKAVESCIKELTTAFAVHNFDDQKRLSDIFKRTLGGSKFPLIIVRSFSDKIFEVRDLPDKRYTSILDVVRTDNVMVINTLIDQYQIHKVLLFENSKDATRVMFSDKQFPENVIRGFDIEGNTYEGGRSTAQYVNKWTGNLKLVASSDEQINSLQRQLEQLQTEKVKLEEAKRGVDKEANKISDSIKEVFLYILIYKYINVYSIRFFFFRKTTLTLIWKKNISFFLVFFISHVSLQIQNHIRAESMKVQRLTHEIKELQNGLREEESNVDILALERSKQSVEEEIQT